MKKVEANEVANWFLSKVNSEAGDTISPLKLQKLVYYGQAWHLAIFGEPLFDEEIQAWMHGPVIPSIYERFEETCKDCVIEIDKNNLDYNIAKTSEELLFEVLEIYGEHSAGYLEQLSHIESPWLDSRGDLPPHVASNNVIEKDKMLNFYKELNEKKAS